MDVGVDCWNFYPISLEQVAVVMQHKKAGGLARDWTLEAGQLVPRAETRPVTATSLSEA
ncbi:MAG: hypothetical protein SNJ82_05635 [Gemmataceae bacterium]